MSNALETVEVTGVTTNKSSVIDQAIAQVAGAVNDESQINLAAGNAVLLAADVFYNISLQVINATVVGRSITWPNKARYNLILWLDATNTQSVNLIKGSTTIALTPSTTYIIRSGPGANDIEARILASLGPVSPYVIKAGDIMTGPLVVPAGTVALPGMAVGEVDTGFYQVATGSLSMTVDGVEWGRFTGGSGLAIGGGFANGANDLIDVRALLTGARVYMRSQVSAGFLAQRTSADASGPTNVLRKNRGTHAAIAAPNQNDTIGSVIWQFSTGGTAGAETGGATAGSNVLKVTAAVPSDTDGQSQFIWNLCPAASVTNTQIMSLDWATGLVVLAPVTLSKTGAGVDLIVRGEGSSSVAIKRYQTGQAPSFEAYGGRGTIAAPGQSQSGDECFQFGGYAYDNLGATHRIVKMSGFTRELVTGTAAGGRLSFFATPIGSTAEPELMRMISTGIMIGASADPTQLLHLRRTGAVNAAVFVQGESNVWNFLERYSADSVGPSFISKKARGTIAVPTVIASGDNVFSLLGEAYDGAVDRIGGEIRINVTAVTPSATDMESRLIYLLCPAGSVTRTENARFDHATGWSMGGANPVVNQNRIHRMRSTTIAGAIAASFAGQQAYFSDAENSKGAMVRDDGSQYILVGQRGVQRLTSDADATFTPISSGSRVRDTSTLTAERKLTLASTNRSDGQECWYARTGSGNFARAVYQSDGSTLIKRMPPNSWAIFIYDSTAALWYLDKFGSLNTAGDVIQAAVSDETTALTTGTSKITFRAPYAMYVTDVRASLSTAQTSGTILTVDINEAGSTIISTKLTIDNTEKTSTTAVAAPVISDAFIADDAEITVDIDQIGDGTAKGLKITIIGMRM